MLFLEARIGHGQIVAQTFALWNDLDEAQLSVVVVRDFHASCHGIGCEKRLKVVVTMTLGFLFCVQPNEASSKMDFK